MKIYTKKGDKGHTSTLTKMNISKGDNIFNILGKIDELNVYTGNFNTDFDKDIQRILIYISAHIQNTPYNLNTDEYLKDMESVIDNITSTLPQLTNFLLIGNNPMEQNAHRCRVICRDVERMIMSSNIPYIDPGVLKIFNRMSDYWFTIARVYSTEQNEYLGLPDKYVN